MTIANRAIGTILACLLIATSTPVSAGGGDWWDEIPDDWERLYPSDAPADLCRGSNGQYQPATGPGAATWFRWGGGGCGAWKVFDTTPGQPMTVVGRADSCPGCVLWRINYDIYELEDGQWVKKEEVRGPEQRGAIHYHDYTPSSNQTKIQSLTGFYIYTFQERELPVLGVPLGPPLMVTGDESWYITGTEVSQISGEPAKEVLLPASESDLDREMVVKSEGAKWVMLVWRSSGPEEGYFFGVQHFYDPPRAMWGEGQDVLGQKYLDADVMESKWTSMRVTVQGDHFQMFFDEEIIFDVKDNRIDEAGRTGLRAYGEAKIRLI